MEAGWKLQELKIGFERGWRHEGSIDRYEGRITFTNGAKESFTFNLNPDESSQLVGIIAQKVVETASKLGVDLAKSLLGCDAHGIITPEQKQPKES